MIEDLGPAQRIAVGAIGQPGSRRFYLEVTADDRVISLLTEKQQVAELATRGIALLDEHGISSDDDAVAQIVSEGLDIVDPGEGGERFRVSEVTIGLAPSELLTFTIEGADVDDGITFVIAPEQFRAMAFVALQVVAAGRPDCPWCRLPMDPDGHECPARNGHSPP